MKRFTSQRVFIKKEKMFLAAGLAHRRCPMVTNNTSDFPYSGHWKPLCLTAESISTIWASTHLLSMHSYLIMTLSYRTAAPTWRATSFPQLQLLLPPCSPQLSPAFPFLAGWTPSGPSTFVHTYPLVVSCAATLPPVLHSFVTSSWSNLPDFVMGHSSNTMSQNSKDNIMNLPFNSMLL